ncbi:MAG: DUF6062 family protein [Actinomycetota bacterium]|nr:DUF6062 family protein [Actinomycetota bacterium]MDP9485218.1 DUF6062 family protein [Actinomycetota bacterium]
MSESPKGMSRFELEEALRQQGCAVCRLVERAGSSYLEYLLYDLVNDPDVQKEFRASLGFCASHAQGMLEKGDGLGVAILYRAAAKELLGRLSKIPDAPRSRASLAGLLGRSTKAEPIIPEPGEGCMVCDAERQAERRYLQVLLEGAEDGSLDNLVKGSGSVCVRHLSRASAVAGGWLPSALIEATREAFGDLESDLGRYVRHSDYRFQDEPWGKERDSWKRVVARMLGRRRV